MRFISDAQWEETKKRFNAWWANGLYERPVMMVTAAKEPSGMVEEPKLPDTPEDVYLSLDYLVQQAYYRADTSVFMGETYPVMCIRFGPGSMSIYQGGAEPRFSYDTVWFHPHMRDIEDDFYLEDKPESYWWRRHVQMHKDLKARVGDDFFLACPDIIENLDVLSAMRGPEPMCYDLMDSPETVKRHLHRIDELFEYYYNQIYDLIKLPDGSSCFNAFRVWGPGKTAKVQCDFAALISPNQFREFVIPSLSRECRFFNNTVFHLDGPQAMVHVDALMEIKELNALQFTCGEMRPDGTNEMWWEVYEKVRKANKALWIQVYDGDPDQWMASCDKFVKKFGPNGLYFSFPKFDTIEQAQDMLHKAELDWH